LDTVESVNRFELSVKGFLRGRELFLQV